MTKKRKITAYLDADTANKLYSMAYTGNGTSKYGAVSNIISSAINSFYVSTTMSASMHTTTDSTAYTVRTDLVISEDEENEM